MLTDIAASGHLAYDTAIFPYFFPCLSVLGGGQEKKVSPGPKPAQPPCVLPSFDYPSYSPHGHEISLKH